MSTPFTSEVQAFHQFLGEQLQTPQGGEKSREELLALCRAEHPSSDELRESVAAVKEALADMEAGDAGRPVDDVIDELRKKVRRRIGSYSVVTAIG
ncbi:MAG: hypothetical protein KY475_05335 [Planctomycetes bacterium]|nr:hypothetical protein [Planctomycetota bacterium]